MEWKYFTEKGFFLNKEHACGRGSETNDFFLTFDFLLAAVRLAGAATSPSLQCGV
jgi:hypothetical protein